MFLNKLFENHKGTAKKSLSKKRLHTFLRSFVSCQAVSLHFFDRLILLTYRIEILSVYRK